MSYYVSDCESVFKKVAVEKQKLFTKLFKQTEGKLSNPLLQFIKTESGEINETTGNYLYFCHGPNAKYFTNKVTIVEIKIIRKTFDRTRSFNE